MGRVARVKRDEKGHIVVHHNDRTFLYRTKKELKADGPMMDILNPYRNYCQATLLDSLKAKEKVGA